MHKNSQEMKTFHEILVSLVTKMDDILGCVLGWVTTGICCIINYFAGEKTVFIAVFSCVILDAVAGIWSAIRQKKYARSELLRDTCSKLFAYVGSLIVVILIGRLIGFDNMLATSIVASVICACELWSMSASFLIINPNLVFFQLIRVKLVGEIARKLGVPEEKVQEAFEDNTDLIELNKKN